MATTTEKLEDPNLNEEDQDAIVGAFVRQQENERLRKHWETLLKEKHQVTRQASSPKRSATIRRFIFPILTVAAALLLLFILLPNLMTDNGEELLAANLTEISIEGDRSGSGTDADSLRSQVRTAYLAGDFLAAAASGQRLLDLPEATEEDQLNVGISHLRSEDYLQANDSFKLLLGASSNLKTEARYYLGLSLLSSGDTAVGLKELGKITEADGRNIYQKAQALIDARW
jgi:hypothetical protein